MTLPPAQAVPARRPFIGWDIAVALVIMVLAVIADLLVTFSALFLVMAGDSCGSGSVCSISQLTIGWLIALIAPSVVLVVAIVIAVVRIFKRRISWWIVLVGAVLMLAVWGLGVWLVFSAVKEG
ncbi:MAG: hypothetical protein JWO10_2217 [Microbacteriaceae bacterium]|nr:hypothetical protein [Microbacteriaceae bacterium]